MQEKSAKIFVRRLLFGLFMLNFFELQMKTYSLFQKQKGNTKVTVSWDLSGFFGYTKRYSQAKVTAPGAFSIFKKLL